MWYRRDSRLWNLTGPWVQILTLSLMSETLYKSLNSLQSGDDDTHSHNCYAGHMNP